VKQLYHKALLAIIPALISGVGTYWQTDSKWLEITQTAMTSMLDAQVDDKAIEICRDKELQIDKKLSDLIVTVNQMCGI